MHTDKLFIGAAVILNPTAICGDDIHWQKDPDGTAVAPRIKARVTGYDPKAGAWLAKAHAIWPETDCQSVITITISDGAAGLVEITNMPEEDDGNLQ